MGGNENRETGQQGGLVGSQDWVAKYGAGNGVAVIDLNLCYLILY